MTFTDITSNSQSLDSLRTSGQLKGVLHGIPVSVKETILLKVRWMLSLAVVDGDGEQGYDSTAGIAKRCGILSEEDSVAIAAIKVSLYKLFLSSMERAMKKLIQFSLLCLQEAGGVPFCRTNIPQTNLSYGCRWFVAFPALFLFHIWSSNPIYGATCNPFKKDRTSGGSSGGEAALISCGGSVLGMGTDIGGSIRVPAAFCGICGFKPFSG